MKNYSELTRLSSELSQLKSSISQQLKESQEKFRIQLDLQKSENCNITESIKQLSEENLLLKDHLKNSETKITRLEKENEELTQSLEFESTNTLENSEEFQYQVSVLNEKIKNFHALLKAEKLKTLDTMREKSEIQEIGEMTQKNNEKKVIELSNEVNKEREKLNELKQQLESRNKVVQSADLENLSALNDHLAVKQRTIENLFNEKETLVALLEFERSEKAKLQENKLNNRVVRQALTSSAFLNNWPKSKNALAWVDDKFQFLTDSVEKSAFLRGLVILYVIFMHFFLLVNILGTSPSTDFLPS